MQTPSRSEGSNFADTQTLRMSQIGATTPPASKTGSAGYARFTRRYGWRITALYLRAMTSTIGMGIILTTLQGTWSAFRAVSTKRIMLESTVRPVSILGRIGSRTSIGSGRWRQRGTVPPQAGRFMRLTAGRLGMTALQKIVTASTVGLGTRSARSLVVGGSAPVGAGRRGAGQRASTTSRVSARTVIGSSGVTGMRDPGSVLVTVPQRGVSGARRQFMFGDVSVAEGSSGLGPRACLPGSVPIYVVSGGPLPELREVWNLTVDDAAEYFASGVLVHNCDSARYSIKTTEQVWRPYLQAA